MKNILITGATGFLGVELIKQCFNKGYNPIAIGHSEHRIVRATKKFPDLPIYCADICTDKPQIKNIIKQHKVDYIIHTAALKHVSICELNATRAAEINIIGSKNILDLCLEHDVKNAIAVSTDKAINAINVYGRTKNIMEKMFLENNFSTCRGVNFLFSTGSVLDIWNDQMSNNTPITINKKNTTRFFIDIEDIATKIINNLDIKKTILYPDECLEIALHDLADALCEIEDFNKKVFVDCKDESEKVIEEIPNDVIKINKPNKEELKSILTKKIEKWTTEKIWRFKNEK